MSSDEGRSDVGRADVGRSERRSGRAQVGLGAALLGVAVALGAACEPTPSLEEASCDGGTDLTYESFGATFMLRYCNMCHVPGLEDRHGAPSGYDFDDLEQVRRHAARIYVRSAGDNVSMPPGPDDPPVEERDKLAEWLACGAPSEADATP